MKEIIKAITILMLGLGFLGLIYVQSEKWMKNRAVSECKEISIYEEKINEWITIKRPIEEEYVKCMKEKGYK